WELADLAPGSHRLVAVALDELGALTESSAVAITVRDVPNASPSILISGPQANSEFPTGEAITVTIEASDPDGTVAWVELLIDDVSLGRRTESPWNWVLEDLAPGTYRLTGVAADDLGLTSATIGVDITVLDADVRPERLFRSGFERILAR
ncbi:MAG: Ig-like domain-containing protein, partial [Pseudomonadota bacterium]